ncbi:intraflagellar transport protein 57 homolog [Octopus bimaculoides]|uniref:Intraflagellar transport protein 57 homolog n=1 Tax=Octopus bimaculoides TaxID=37653 RepID=A0A0L8FP59_OCTBM|nr:intraflagellar transport protein 57 homolog [Octopus bimaculoides]|eukprot:XP_014788112.1 PREDICTED: intraflagellar transport protein 57 homolog [Octopus bimaculoides]
MSEEKRRTEEIEDVSPGIAYLPFVNMEELLEKLRLLNYEKSFMTIMNMKPLSRHYFALPTNPGEQFYMFTCLAAWLIQGTGRQFDIPQEKDDPNATISSILEVVRDFGYTLNFAPSKLKQGCGEHCIYVLNRLADEALKRQNFKWAKPVYPEEEEDEEIVIMAEDMELDLNKMEEDGIVDEADAGDDFDEEPLMRLDNLQSLKESKLKEGSSKPDNILESQTNLDEWLLEVQRVTPQLKVLIRTDNKDWRLHVDQMHQHKNNIEVSMEETKSYLQELQDEIDRSLEKIRSREKYTNKQLDHSLTEFRALQDQLAEIKERYRQASGGLTDRSRILAEITEELDKVKSEMEERGNTMTDGAPLVKIKQTLQQLKKECSQMDVRSGVVEHILLQAKLKDKNIQNKQAHTIEMQEY